MACLGNIYGLGLPQLGCRHDNIKSIHAEHVSQLNRLSMPVVFAIRLYASQTSAQKLPHETQHAHRQEHLH